MGNKFLRVQRVVMIILGKWQFSLGSESLDKLYKIYSWCIHIYFFGILQTMPFAVISKWECKEVVLKIESLYMLHINVFIIGIIANSDKMKNVLSYINDNENLMYSGKPNLLQKTYDTYCKLNFNVEFFGIGCTSCIILYAFYTMEAMTTFGWDENDICAPEKGRLYYFWLPFDTVKYFWMAMIFEIFEITIGGISYMYNKLIPVTVSIYLLGQIKMLQEMLKRVDGGAIELQATKNIALEKALDMLIYECIKKHQEILSLMDLLNQAVRTIIIVEYFTSILEMAIFLIKMLTAQTTGEGILVVIIACVVAIQLLCSLWQTNEVYLQSQIISDIIYNEMNWIDYSVTMKKKLILMMFKCQKPLSLRVIGVGDMTLDTYKKMLKICYSIVTFFKTIYN